MTANQNLLQNEVLKQQNAAILKNTPKKSNCFIRRWNYLRYGFDPSELQENISLFVARITALVLAGTEASECILCVNADAMALPSANMPKRTRKNAEAANIIPQDFDITDPNQINETTHKFAMLFAKYADNLSEETLSHIDGLMAERDKNKLVSAISDEVKDGWKELGNLILAASPEHVGDELRKTSAGSYVGRGFVSAFQRLTRGYDDKQKHNANIVLVAFAAVASEMLARCQDDQDSAEENDVFNTLNSYALFLDESEPTSKLICEYSNEKQVQGVVSKAQRAWNSIGDKLFG